MATRTLHMNKVREIIRLIETGMEERAISRAVQRSRTSVRYIKLRIQAENLTYKKISELNDEILKSNIYPSKDLKDERKKQFDELLQEILKNLGKKHETLEHQWELYRKGNTSGYGYSQFCYYIKKASKENEVCMALHHEYGDMMFVDFAGSKLYYIDPFSDNKIEVEVFVAVLPASQYTYVECRMSQRLEDFIPVHENAIRFFGGSPKAIVPDCLKSAVTKAHKYESIKNPQYEQFAEHYNTVIIPARPLHPKDKALVEITVNNIYRYIYPRLNEKEYYSLQELNVALFELVQKYNSRIMKGYGCSRLELFESYEKKVLKLLPTMYYEYKKYQAPRAVSYGVYVFLSEDKHYYSVPVHVKDKEFAIFYTNSSVELHTEHMRVAIHNRERGLNRFTTNPEHLPEKHREYIKWTPERLIDWGKSVGKYSHEIIKQNIEQAKHPFEGIRTCLYILSLSKNYGEVRLNNACRRALDFGVLNGSRIESILKKNMDNFYEEQLIFEDIPDHENIRYKYNYQEEIK